jgi:hypothetical protein
VSSTTGYPCNGATGLGTASGVYYNVPGCSSTSGFSSVNGMACSTVTSVANINGVAYIPGCTSYTGYSSTTGELCLLSVGVTNNTGTPVIPTTPGLPDTGLGHDAPLMTFMILASLGMIAYGAAKLSKQQ